MFNIKWGGVAAAAAFVLAFALSLILGQTGLLIALFRAAVFAALFFGLGTATWLLINTFIPELLSSSGTGDIATHLFSTGPTGSRVNITVGDGQNASLPVALPEQNNSAQGDVGDFNELFTPKDVDQTSATSYTEGGETEGLDSGGEFAPEGEFSPTEEFASTEEFGSIEGEFGSKLSENGLNDGDEAEDESEDGFSMDFSAFVPGGLGGDDDEETEESDAEADTDDPFSFFPEGSSSTTREEPAPERKATGNKPMKLEGDFNAKEIAAGLRTVLEKDKK